MANNILYITSLKSKNRYGTKLNEYIRKYIIETMDISCITKLDCVDLNKYILLIIDSLCLLPTLNFYDLKTIYDNLEKIKIFDNVVLYMHDLHDYSLHYNGDYIEFNIFKENNCQEVFKPNLENNKAKEFFYNFLSSYNIKYLISIYDCPEFDFYVKYFDNVKKFYIFSHGFENNIFKPKDLPKKYDVLFYGRLLEMVYPLRTRIVNICKSMDIKLKIINDASVYYEDSLCDIINESYLCIACVSNFSYFVMKYLEISACNCLVLGDINDQARLALGDNMVYVDMEMDDNKIKEIIYSQLNDKKSMKKKISNNHTNLKNYTYENLYVKLKNIIDNILDDKYCDAEYFEYKNKLNNVNKDK